MGFPVSSHEWFPRSVLHQLIARDELRAIKRHLASRSDRLPWLFLSERGQPLTRQAAHYLVATGGARRADLGDVHPHTLRHACGYYLATDPASKQSD